MRLAEFILQNIEPILVEWEGFARRVWPGGATTDPRELRDHAADILRATAWDMKSAQTSAQQSDKSKGDGDAGALSDRIDGASDVHAAGRVRSGFDMLAVVAEYRALRASVIRLWRESGPAPDLSDIDDVTRFNESIDQSLTEAVRSYTQQVDRGRQMFLAILGHDLRNPLNSAMLSAEVLVRTANLDDESREMAMQISASTTAMGSMIADLLHFTGAGLGAAMPVSPQPMDLRQVCQEVVEETRAANPTRTVRFNGDATPRGNWDPARLRQLVSNLLGNAVQHGDAVGPIDLTMTEDESNVTIAVRNFGTPIPQDALATIFDPLVRGMTPELQKNRRPGSIGLGLYIVREVANAHGGSVKVTSSDKDGTVFTVRLPRVNEGLSRR